MQNQHDNHETGQATEATLDELFGTLWAISVITRRMAGQIYAIRQKKGEPRNEQDVRTVHRHCRTSQVW